MTNININEIINAVETLNSAQAMHDKMKSDLVPMTIDAVNTIFERILEVAIPIANVLQRIRVNNPEIASLIYNTTGTSKYREGEYYTKFTIVDVDGVFTPVIDCDTSGLYYAFHCIEKPEENPVRFGYNHHSTLRNFHYNKIAKEITPNFEAKMYEAIKWYVDAVILALTKRAESIIKDTNKLADTLKQVAGDDTAKQIICKNIHIGNGINGAYITDDGIVVDICGNEYTLHVTKIATNKVDEDESWL